MLYRNEKPPNSVFLTCDSLEGYKVVKVGNDLSEIEHELHLVIGLEVSCCIMINELFP